MLVGVISVNIFTFSANLDYDIFALHTDTLCTNLAEGHRLLYA